MSRALARTHSLRRTNPKGERFIGVCVLCGQAELPAEAVAWECPNLRRLSDDEAVIEAIIGEKGDE